MRFPVHIDYAHRRGRNGHSDRQSRCSSSPILENRGSEARSPRENCSCETCDEMSNSDSMPPLVKPLSRQSFDCSKNPSQGEKSGETIPSRLFDTSSSQCTLQNTESTMYSQSLPLTCSQRDHLSSTSLEHPQTSGPVLQTSSSTRDTLIHSIIFSSNQQRWNSSLLLSSGLLLLTHLLYSSNRKRG